MSSASGNDSGSDNIKMLDVMIGLEMWGLKIKIRNSYSVTWDSQEALGRKSVLPQSSIGKIMGSACTAWEELWKSIMALWISVTKKEVFVSKQSHICRILNCNKSSDG